jgi:NitT/TauT family transport system permease protein
MRTSERQKAFIRRYKLRNFLIRVCQIFVAVFILIVWEFLARNAIINSFITSYPSKVISTICNLFKTGDLIHHILVTLNETLIAFFITGIVSIFVSILIYRSDTFSRIIDPYLTVFNSLPKVALGPVLIIWVGANKKSIILMAVLISIIVSIQSISLGFKNTNKNRIKLLKTFGASETDVFRYAVLPSNYGVIINAFKINVGMCLIGVVMGEFLTSKAGIGYLILYGSQVFNLTLVMSGIVILLILSILLYAIISLIEKHLDF